jgi:hypothetical protein
MAKKKKSIWDVFDFDDSKHSDFRETEKHLEEAGEQLEKSSHGVLTYHIWHNNDYINYCLSFYVKSKYLGGYKRKLFSVAFEEDKKPSYSIWNHCDGINEQIYFDSVIELQDRIQDEINKQPVRKIVENLYSQTKMVMKYNSGN